MAGEHYALACLHCGKKAVDTPDRFLLSCDGSHPASLLRAVYSSRRLEIRGCQPGLFRYGGWLPIRRVLAGAGGPVVFQADRLGGRLGLESLYVAFNGYWPERGAVMETASFKELEALAVCARLSEDTPSTMVVSSAGNTARAFLQVGSTGRVPMIVVIPEFALPEMWITVEKHPRVKLAVLQGPADYLNAIQLGNLLASLDGYFPEGGARNVARRDGMGTVMLAGVEAIGEIPHHYVQAVGSGTGGIAAWEMNLRLIEDGRFGGRKTKLHLVQNRPFTLMVDAWRRGARDTACLSDPESSGLVGRMHARVLSNRQPPYGLYGGVFDALTDSRGGMYAVSNEEARLAGALFEQVEGCDLDPAAEVALAGLMQAVERGLIGKKEIVLLNVTGGGRKRLWIEKRARAVQPDLVFRPEQARREAVAEGLARQMDAKEVV
jgi:cysteate synthase